jgi:hypothetical protein
VAGGERVIGISRLSDPSEILSGATHTVSCNSRTACSAARKTIRSDVQYNPQTISSVRGCASRHPRSPHPPSLAPIEPSSQEDVRTLTRSQGHMAICLSFIQVLPRPQPRIPLPQTRQRFKRTNVSSREPRNWRKVTLRQRKTLYKRSVEIKKTPSSLFNLGVTHYHLSQPETSFHASHTSKSM